VLNFIVSRNKANISLGNFTQSQSDSNLNTDTTNNEDTQRTSEPEMAKFPSKIGMMRGVSELHVKQSDDYFFDPDIVSPLAEPELGVMDSALSNYEAIDEDAFTAEQSNMLENIYKIVDFVLK